MWGHNNGGDHFSAAAEAKMIEARDRAREARAREPSPESRKHEQEKTRAAMREMKDVVDKLKRRDALAAAREAVVQAAMAYYAVKNDQTRTCAGCLAFEEKLDAACAALAKLEQD
jgi:hypothetical protein